MKNFKQKLQETINEMRELNIYKGLDTDEIKALTTDSVEQYLALWDLREALQYYKELRHDDNVCLLFHDLLLSMRVMEIANAYWFKEHGRDGFLEAHGRKRQEYYPTPAIFRAN